MDDFDFWLIECRSDPEFAKRIDSVLAHMDWQDWHPWSQNRYRLDDE